MTAPVAFLPHWEIAANSAQLRFDLNQEVDKYLKFYEETIASHSVMDQKSA